MGLDKDGNAIVNVKKAVDGKKILSENDVDIGIVTKYKNVDPNKIVDTEKNGNRKTVIPEKRNVVSNKV